MCEMLGTEASEDQLPMELEDLLRETRVALKIHSSLKDTWEGMNGVYLGKSLQGLDTLFSIYRVDTASYKIYVLNMINYVDYYIYKDVERKKKRQAKRNT